MSIKPYIIDHLTKLVGSESLQSNVSLSEVSAWKTGGVASLMIEPDTEDRLVDVLLYLHAINLGAIVIGNTSNLLFDDRGLSVPLIKISSKLSHVLCVDDNVYAQAGIWVPGFALKMMTHCLSGVEHISGIPGTLGGLVCMNGGSLRKCIGSSIISVKSIDFFGNVFQRSASECAFAYRSSIYQKKKEIITSVRMLLSSKPRPSIRNEMLSILRARRKKFPRKSPNCGSVFKSSPTLYNKLGPPGFVIQKLGFSGCSIGGAVVSPQHANFIVNRGNATSRDIIKLVQSIHSKVLSETNFSLEAEPLFVSFDGVETPLHLVE